MTRDTRRWAVGLVNGSVLLKTLDTEDDAVKFVGELEGVEDGRYYVEPIGPEPRPATYDELIELAQDVAMGNTEYDTLSDRAIELLANAPERSIEDSFQDVALKLRDLNEAILNSDLDDEELRGQWATALDYFDRVHQEYGG